MPKPDPAAQAVAMIAALRSVDDPVKLGEELNKLLDSKSSYVIQRAAELAAERKVRATLPQVLKALDHMLRATSLKDTGCAARFALARAAVELEAGFEAEEIFELGVRHANWEPGWGGSTDTAVTVRGQCVIGLAAMASRQALRRATELLAESDLKSPRERISWPARQDAARALRMIGSDGAAAVLRFKALCGDPEPNVLSECLLGLIAIEPEEGLALAERFLTGQQLDASSRRDSDADAEAALLAIGGSRKPAAAAVLLRHEHRFIDSRTRPTYFAALAMTRQDVAIDFLLAQVAHGSDSVSKAAAESLEPLRLLPRVGDRLSAAIKERSSKPTSGSSKSKRTGREAIES